MPYKDPKKNRECRDNYMKTEKGKLTKWKHNLKKQYGITPEDYDAMYEAQKGCCAICFTHQVSMNYRLHVDHCHKTGKVRGLLCKNCNLALGNFQDSVKLLARAIEYLED